ncbi:MAG: zinc-dependent alcohol dehydrogenase family protein [Anaerolineae bacterium]
MKAVSIREPNVVEVVERPRPSPGPEEVLIAVRACGICGTDVHIFRGEYMGHYPVTPGHEFAGVVTAVGAEVTRFTPGDRVAVEPNLACDNCANCLNNRQNFCLNWEAIGVTRPGGMAEFVVAPENAVFDIGLLPFEVGAFMEPLSCVLHGVQKAQVRLADKVAILGAGPIGQLLAQTVRLQGAVEVTVVERNAARGELALALGADRWVEDVDALEEERFDVVIDASGAIPLMARAIDLARRGGTVLFFGVAPAGRRMEIEPFQVFEKGLTLLSSFTSVRNSLQAVALLQAGKIDVAPLISHRLPLDAFERGVTLIEKGLEDVKKVLLVR